MKNFIYFTLLVFTFSSCSKHSELQNSFDCNSVLFKDTKIISDFNKNFKLTVPRSWKTELYYNSYQSEIFTADTTKQLTETFIFDVSFNLGKLIFDETFFKKTDSMLNINNFHMVNSGKQSFQKMPAYWYLIKGVKKGFTMHQFNLLVKKSNTTYFTAYSEIYGDEHINERICESISLLEKIEFLE